MIEMKYTAVVALLLVGCFALLQIASADIVRQTIGTSEMKRNITSRTRVSIGNFNFIRILAAIFVIFSHSYALTGNIEPSLLGISLGAWGVLIFFAISGFLLTKSSDFSLYYFWKRGLRIFPGLIIVVSLTTLFLGPLTTSLRLNEYFSRTETWSYLIRIGLWEDALPGVFTNNPFPNAVNGSLWMLPYLFSMYIILFLYANLKLLTTRHIIILYFLGFAMLIIQPIIYMSIKTVVHASTPTMVVSAAAPHVTYNIFPVFRKIINYIASMMLSANFYRFYLCFFGGVLLALYKGFIKFNYKESVVLLFMAVLAYTIVPSSATYIPLILVPYFVIFLSLIQSNIFNRFETLGDFSYGMFIYAFPVQQAIAYYAGNNLTPLKMFLLALPITVVFAVASWYIIESPMQKLKNWKLRS